MRRRGVCSVEVSRDEKTGPVSTTYVSQNSCGECQLHRAGCYGEDGHVGIVTRSLNLTAGDSLNEMELAREEARQIDGLSGERDLRLHVVGDCACDGAARIVARACARYRKRHGSAVWTYTHSGLTVKRASWGDISVLASCETLAEIIECRARGYAVATVEGEDIGPALKAEGFRLIQCPAQVSDTDCRNCRLCMMGVRMYGLKVVINFQAHGSRSRMVREFVAQKRKGN